MNTMRIGCDGVTPSWLALRVHGASVAAGRRFAEDVVSAQVADPDHAHTIVLVVSELLTNALRAARTMVADGLVAGWRHQDRPLRLGVTATGRWTHVRVADPDPRPFPEPRDGEPLAETGRGLPIVDALAVARWVRYRRDGKTVHAVVAAPGLKLTETDVATIRMVAKGPPRTAPAVPPAVPPAGARSRHRAGEPA